MLSVDTFADLPINPWVQQKQSWTFQDSNCRPHSACHQQHCLRHPASCFWSQFPSLYRLNPQPCPSAIMLLMRHPGSWKTKPLAMLPDTERSQSLLMEPPISTSSHASLSSLGGMVPRPLSQKLSSRGPGPCGSVCHCLSWHS